MKLGKGLSDQGGEGPSLTLGPRGEKENTNEKEAWKLGYLPSEKLISCPWQQNPVGKAPDMPQKMLGRALKTS